MRPTMTLTRDREGGRGRRPKYEVFLPRFFTKKRAESRDGVSGRAPQSAEYSYAHTRSGKGSGENPAKGFAPVQRSRIKPAAPGRGWNPAPTRACAEPRGRPRPERRVVEDADPYGGLSSYHKRSRWAVRARDVRAGVEPCPYKGLQFLMEIQEDKRCTGSGKERASS